MWVGEGRWEGGDGRGRCERGSTSTIPSAIIHSCKRQAYVVNCEGYVADPWQYCTSYLVSPVVTRQTCQLSRIAHETHAFVRLYICEVRVHILFRAPGFSRGVFNIP